MSTGLDCYFEEKEPGQWWLYLESYSYRDEYEEYGPFTSFPEAQAHLHDNFTNPGGYSVELHEHTDGTYPDA
jgi:hypothetical protein